MSTSKVLFKIMLYIRISSESSFCPIKYDTNNTGTYPLANALFRDILTLDKTHGQEDTRKSKYCRSNHIICSLIYYIFGRQCSKLPCIYGQLGHLWWSAVDRSMACGNMIAIIRKHGKSDSCINGYSLLWYFKMSTHHHKLSGEEM